MNTIDGGTMTEFSQYDINNLCWKRAMGLWWEVGFHMYPSELISWASDEDDKKYLKLMDEREEILELAFWHVRDLYEMKDDNSKDPVFIKNYGSEVIEKAVKFGKKFQKLYKKRTEKDTQEKNKMESK